MRKYMLVAGVLLAGCRREASTVKIGMAGPLKESYGTMTRRGMELAIEEINASPEQHIKLVPDTADDEADGKRAAAIAQRFVDDPSIVGVVGHVTSGAMKAAAKVYDGHLAAIATSASAPELTGISRWAFRVIASDSANGITLGRYANKMQSQRAAILYENNPYGRGLVESFQKSYKGQVVSIDPIGEGRDQDFEPFVAYYRQRQPDLLFVASTEIPGIPIVRAIVQSGLKMTLMGGDGWTGLTAEPTLAENALVGAPFTAEDPRKEARAFTERFRKKFNMDPDGNAALGYDATQILAEAVREVGGNRAKIRDYVAGLTQRTAHQGATGRIYFTAGGDPAATGMVMTKVQNGVLKVAGAE